MRSYNLACVFIQFNYLSYHLIDCVSYNHSLSHIFFYNWYLIILITIHTSFTIDNKFFYN